MSDTYKQLSGVDFWQLQRFLRGTERQVEELVEPLAGLWGLSGRQFLRQGFRILEEELFDRLEACYQRGDREETLELIAGSPELMVAHQFCEQLRCRYGIELDPYEAYRAFQQDPDRDELEVDVAELLTAAADDDPLAF